MQSIDHIQWPGWDVVRIIGRGSFGAVYEIQRDVFGETEKAALKVITIPENSADIDDLRVEGYDDESITSRFQSYLEDIVKEYSTMAKMKGHPNVVYCDDVKYVQHDDGIGWDIYIKMELLTPIMKCLDQVENEQSVIDLGIAMCNALVLCKERSIVHRDIKPQNIFISRDGTFKLGDFGIAKTAERTTSGTKIGTYKYMAPEVYNNRPYGPAADQYSLGLVMYWLLNDRRTPFSPKKATASEEEEARKRRFNGEQIPPPAHGSKRLQDIVLRACSFDPKERFFSAEEMLNALHSIKLAPAHAPRAKVEDDKAEAIKAATPAVAASETVEDRTVGLIHSNAREEKNAAVIDNSESLMASQNAQTVSDNVSEQEDNTVGIWDKDSVNDNAESTTTDAQDLNAAASDIANLSSSVTLKRSRTRMKRIIAICLGAFFIISVLIGIILVASDASGHNNTPTGGEKSNSLLVATNSTELSKATSTESKPEPVSEQTTAATVGQPKSVAHVNTSYEGERSVWKSVVARYDEGCLFVDPRFDVEIAMNLYGGWNGRFFIGSKSCVNQVADTEAYTIELQGINNAGTYQIEQIKTDKASGALVGSASYTIEVTGNGTVELASLSYDKSVWKDYSVWPEMVSGKVFLHISNFGWYGEWDFDTYPELTVDTYSCNNKKLLIYNEIEDSYSYFVDLSQTENTVLFQVKEYPSGSTSPFSTIGVELVWE